MFVNKLAGQGKHTLSGDVFYVILRARAALLQGIMIEQIFYFRGRAASLKSKAASCISSYLLSLKVFIAAARSSGVQL